MVHEVHMTELGVTHDLYLHATTITISRVCPMSQTVFADLFKRGTSWMWIDPSERVVECFDPECACTCACMPEI